MNLTALLKRRTAHPQPPLWVDAAALCTVLLLPNAIICLNIIHGITAAAPPHGFAAWAASIPPDMAALWLISNGALCSLLAALRVYIIYPLFGLAPELEILLHELNAQPGPARMSLLNRACTAIHQHLSAHRTTRDNLQRTTEALTSIRTLQQLLLNNASQAMLGQYQSVLTHAHHLEERIRSRTLDPDLRYEMDDLCESGFNLKLIAGTLTLLHQPPAPAQAVPLAQLMESTLLALAASLDRRCMKLTTREVDANILAAGDPSSITHILWMVLLGTIRYAAEESTLRLRCLYNHEHTSALISISISELAPGNLTAEERHHYLLHQHQQQASHLFAETLRIHANLQLAESLAAHIGGTLSILPLSSHSCEICLSLPSAASAG